MLSRRSTTALAPVAFVLIYTAGLSVGLFGYSSPSLVLLAFRFFIDVASAAVVALVIVLGVRGS
jgi:hypothetical protein